MSYFVHFELTPSSKSPNHRIHRVNGRGAAVRSKRTESDDMDCKEEVAESALSELQSTKNAATMSSRKGSVDSNIKPSIAKSMASRNGVRGSKKSALSNVEKVPLSQPLRSNSNVDTEDVVECDDAELMMDRKRNKRIGNGLQRKETEK